MSFIDKLVSAALNPATLAQLAMGPAGWASLAVRTVGMAIAQEVLQQVGQELGLPQAVIDTVKATFAQSVGMSGGGAIAESLSTAVNTLASEAGMTPVQAGAVERDANWAIQDMVRDLIGSEEFRAIRAGGSGRGFLERIALALGHALDQKMNKAAALADRIGQQGKDESSQLGKLNGQLSAVSQEINILSNALNNVIKSIGEAQSTMARKG